MRATGELYATCRAPAIDLITGDPTRQCVTGEGTLRMADLHKPYAQEFSWPRLGMVQ